MEKRLVAILQIPWYWILILGLSLIVLTVISYNKIKRLISVRSFQFFIILRVLAVLILLLPLIQPAVEVVDYTIIKPWLILLIDSSKSMSIEDCQGAVSRTRAVEKALSQSHSILDGLSEFYNIETLKFNKDIVRENDREGEFTTAIGTSIVSALGRSMGRKRTLILISDGRNHTGVSPIEASRDASSLGVPIHTVVVGSEKEHKVIDAKVSNVYFPQSSFANNPFKVQASLEFNNCENREFSVRLMIDGKTVDTEQRKISTSEKVLYISFYPTIAKTGIYKIGVELSRIPEEINFENNCFEDFIRIREPVDVIYIDQGRFEFKFIRRALEQSYHFKLTPVLQLSLKEQSSLIPSTAGEWKKYDVVILGDIPASFFSKTQLEGLKEAISQRGTGLLMLGGYNTLGQGGYGESALAEALPVEISSSDIQVETPFNLRPTAKGFVHFTLTLEKTLVKNRSVWENIPQLDGYTQVGNLRPGGFILATGIKDDPVISALPFGFGKGRTLIFGADSTWKWALLPEWREYQNKLWAQITLWLTGRDRDAKDRVWFAFEKTRYRIGSRVPFSVFAENALGEVVADAQVTVNITSPNGQINSMLLSFAGERYPGSFLPMIRGEYRLEVNAERGGKSIGNDKGFVFIFVPEQELEQPEADIQTLQQIANETNAEFKTINQLDVLLNSLPKEEALSKVERKRIKSIWDNWWLLFIFTLLMGMEWAARRNQGLK